MAKPILVFIVPSYYKVALNFKCTFLCEHKFYSSRINAQEYNRCFIWYLHVYFFKKLPNYFPKWLLPFYIPTSNIQMSASSPAFDGVIIFHFTHSDWCVAICLTTSVMMLISIKDWKSITSALSAPTYTVSNTRSLTMGCYNARDKAKSLEHPTMKYGF